MSPRYPPSTPPWFLDAVGSATSEHETAVDGVKIIYRAWNAADACKPPLLFVHGHRGHSHWWDFITPYFRDRFRVFALDLSGMGDSGNRTRYTSRAHAQDIVAVIRAIGTGQITLIGHSYGGGRILRVCADSPQLVKRALVLDSFVYFSDMDTIKEPPRLGRPIPYPDYASARARFRLLPQQDVLDFAFEHVAHHSLKAVPGGWIWKFDPGLSNGVPDRDIAEALDQISVPVDIVAGSDSLVLSAQRAERIVQRLRHGRGPFIVPEAGHHLMLDQPLATVAVLRTLLMAAAPL